MKLKKGAYIQRMELNVFGCVIHICVTEDPDKFVTDSNLRLYCSPENPEEKLGETLSGFMFNKGVSNYYIVIPSEVKAGTAVHECVHCIGRIFGDRGQKADFANDEVYAYYVGWISQTVFNFLAEVKTHIETLKPK